MSAIHPPTGPGKAAAALLAVLIGLIAGICFGQGDAPGPTSEPASASAPTSSPVQSFTVAGSTPDVPRTFKLIDEAMRFNPEEENILSDIIDRHASLTMDKPLGLLLSHVVKIPQLPAKEFSLLENPPVRILRKYPQDFRRQPIRLNVTVYHAERLEPGKTMARTPWWDKPLWRLDCVSAETPDAEGSPLIVLSTTDPMDLLGRPDDVRENGRRLVYKPPGKALEVAGIFYKIYRTRNDPGSARPDAPIDLTDYPVVLAWQLQRSESLGSSWGSGLPGILVGLLVLIAFVLWWRLRRPMRIGVVPERHRPAEREDSPAQDDASYMDPALREAAEQYFLEHPEKRPPRRPVAHRPPGNPPPSEEPLLDIDEDLKRAADQFRKDHPKDGSNR